MKHQNTICENQVTMLKDQNMILQDQTAILEDHLGARTKSPHPPTTRDPTHTAEVSRTSAETFVTK